MKLKSTCGVMGAAFGLLLAAGGARAQQPPATAAGALKIGVVDMERLLAESALAKQQAERLNAIREELRAEGEKRQAALAKLDERLRQQQELLAKDQGALSAEAREQRQQAGAKLLREREAYRQDSEDVLGTIQRRLQREQERAQADVQEKLTALVQTVGAERGIELMLDKRACVSVSAGIDLTAEVMRRAEAQASTSPASSSRPVMTQPKR